MEKQRKKQREKQRVSMVGKNIRVQQHSTN
jgi:hypothetical protein